MRELFVALGFIAAFSGPAVAFCQRHNGSERRHPRHERLQTKRDNGQVEDPNWMPCNYYSSTGVDSCD